MKEKNKGITLIALIITIIVMLILVGVSVSILINSNLIGAAEKTATAYEEARRKEANSEGITINGKTLDEYISVDWEEAKVKVANAPDISGFNKSNTYYVSWDLTSSPYQINEETNLNGVSPNNWYDYTAGVNHYANIKTTGGGNDCYWVWIPRYAYCITEGYHSNTAGTIDIKFLQGTTNTPIDGSNIKINNSSGPGNWNVHPAFWWDKDNDGVEDEGEQLTGIWVAKFEASSSNVSVATVETDLATTGGGDTNSLQVRVIPNVTSWRGITVNNIFTVCRNLTETGNSLENTSNLNSHMMKNIEWGAVAYLSRSVYGINSEVWNNPYYNNDTDHSPITGLCGNETNGKDGYTTNMNNTVKYNEKGGGNASTTGNVYGIYDMAGGAWEYVDKYTNTTGSQKTYYGNTDKYGDAVYETSSSGGDFDSSWDSSYSYFPSPNQRTSVLSWRSCLQWWRCRCVCIPQLR